MNDRVTTTFTDGIADVRLMRADKMNAIDPAMFEAIGAAIDALADRTDVRCVVLSGEGRGFCAGLDMASMARGGSGTSRGLHMGTDGANHARGLSGDGRWRLTSRSSS